MFSQRIFSIVISALAAGVLGAQQLGKESIPRTYSAQPLRANPCVQTFASAMWDVSKPPDASLKPTIKSDCNLAPGDNAPQTSLPILVHGSLWSVTQQDSKIASVSMFASEWEVYRIQKKAAKPTGDGGIPAPVLLQDGKRPDGKSVAWPARPALYGNKTVLFVGVSCFVDPQNLKPASISDLDKQVEITYKVTTTQVTPENIANATAVLKQLFGTPAKGALAAPGTCSAGLATVATIKTDKPPVDIGISLTATVLSQDKNNAGNVVPPALLGSRLLASLHPFVPGSAIEAPPQAKKAAGESGGDTGNADTSKDSSAGCSIMTPGKPCTTSPHTIRAADKEFWDLSIAISIPGVREPQYAASKPTAAPTSTIHTDFYGMLDLYPFCSVASKTSYAPHLTVGVPITGKPLSRPFFGMGENFTGWTTRFPFQMSVFAGVVYMNQEVVVTPSGSSPLIRHARVLKGMYGIEVPVGNLVSKISGVGGSKSKSNSSGK